MPSLLPSPAAVVRRLRRSLLPRPILLSTPVPATPSSSFSSSRMSDEELHRYLAEKERTTPRRGAPVDLDAVRRDFARRRPRATYDVLAPTPSHLLNLTLWDALPAEARPTSALTAAAGADNSLRFKLPAAADPAAAAPLPHGHHLVYFPLQLPPSLLLPDGTDPAQAPGAPLPRRMWAGGELRFRGRGLALGGGATALERAVCVERVDLATLRVKGAAGRERLFVDVWRRYGSVPVEGDGSVAGSLAAAEAAVEADPAIEEVRTLVFLRTTDDSPPEADAMAKASEARQGAPRILKAPHAPDYAFRLTPSASMLFQFSALTFNAHAIHYDPQYCRDVEKHRGLLVHGPLSLVLMLSALRGAIVSSSPTFNTRSIYSFQYRNFAPLYASEELRVCTRRHRQGLLGHRGGRFAKWDVWVENSQGSMCVRGTAVTRDAPDAAEPDELDELPDLDALEKAFVAKI